MRGIYADLLIITAFSPTIPTSVGNMGRSDIKSRNCVAKFLRCNEITLERVVVDLLKDCKMVGRKRRCSIVETDIIPRPIYCPASLDIETRVIRNDSTKVPNDRIPVTRSSRYD